MSIRRILSGFLAFLVLFFTVLSLLSIWDIIEIKYVIQKTLTTLLILFVAAAVMLFIFSVLYKGGNGNDNRGDAGTN